MKEPASVPLFHDGETVENANVGEIDLLSVHHPELCRAEIHLQGSIRSFSEGDEVNVGRRRYRNWSSTEFSRTRMIPTTSSSSGSRAWKRQPTNPGTK